MITICFTFFKTLTLQHLQAALYSVWQQNLSDVHELVIVDNDTLYSEEEICRIVEGFAFPIPVRVLSMKHGDLTRAQAWSTNATVREAKTPWVFYTRADFLLDFTMLAKFRAVVRQHPPDWDGFIVSHGSHLGHRIEDCEETPWRIAGPSVSMLHGLIYDYTEIDSGVWMARRDTYDRIGGFDERLSAWGHAQTEFQYRMFTAGVEFVRIPEVLFYHPQHGGERDIEVGHRQLQALGLDIRQMWERYPGPKFY